MASSGTINSARSGNRPYISLRWSILNQQVSNNRSQVRLRLYFVVPAGFVSFSANKSGVLQGSSFTYTGGFSGNGERMVRERTIWVNHNSDGTRTHTFNGSFNPAINWEGSHLGNINVSGSGTLDTIPRSSEVTAFSMGSSLQISTANSVNVRLNVYSTSFRFDVALRYGSTTIATWNNQNFTHNTSRSLSLNTTQVNNLLSAMRNTASGTVTIRVQTKSGSGGSNIGSVQTRNATASVNSNVTPTATGLSVSIQGSGRDDTIGKFVQGISRVNASFTGNARGGATVSSRSIVIRENSSKSNSMTISGNSGTTGTVTRSGTYEAIASVRDSRGRTTTQRVTFAVHAYSPPRVTVFTAERNASTPTTVNIRRDGSFSGLSGDNTLTIQVQRKPQGGTWANVVNNVSTSNGSFGANVSSTGNSVTQSYDFRIFISDQFNNNAEVTATVTTQRVVLDIHKNEGVGIGKIHEQGVLDVDGKTFFAGEINVVPVITGDEQEGAAININSRDDSGHGYIQFIRSNGERAGYAGFQSANNNNFHIQNHHSDGRINLSAGDGVRIDNREVVARGSNSNGNWVRFYDGTQIAYHQHTLSYSGHTSQMRTDWNTPVNFIDNTAYGFVSRDAYWGAIRYTSSYVSMTPNSNGQGANVTAWSNSGQSWQSGDTVDVYVMMIGRWR